MKEFAHYVPETRLRFLAIYNMSTKENYLLVELRLERRISYQVQLIVFFLYGLQPAGSSAIYLCFACFAVLGLRAKFSKEPWTPCHAVLSFLWYVCLWQWITSGCICFKQQSVTHAYFLFFWEHLSIAGSQKSKGTDKPSQFSKVFAVSVVLLLNTKAKIALCTVLSGNSTVHFLHPPHPTAWQLLPFLTPSFIEWRLEKYFKAHLPSWQVIPNIVLARIMFSLAQTFFSGTLINLYWNCRFPAFRTFNRKGIYSGDQSRQKKWINSWSNANFSFQFIAS